MLALAPLLALFVHEWKSSAFAVERESGTLSVQLLSSSSRRVGALHEERLDGLVCLPSAAVSAGRFAGRLAGRLGAVRGRTASVLLHPRGASLGGLGAPVEGGRQRSVALHARKERNKSQISRTFHRNKRIPRTWRGGGEGGGKCLGRERKREEKKETYIISNTTIKEIGELALAILAVSVAPSALAELNWSGGRGRGRGGQSANDQESDHGERLELHGDKWLKIAAEKSWELLI